MNNYEEEYDVPEEYYGTLNEAITRIVREFRNQQVKYLTKMRYQPQFLSLLF